MSNPADIRLALFQDLQATAVSKMPALAHLSEADPSRILLEIAAEFAADLYTRIKPETERLFESIPAYLALKSRMPSPTRGVIGLNCASSQRSLEKLPKNLECMADTPSGSRRFVTETEIVPVPIQKMIERQENGVLYLGLCGIGSAPEFRIYLSPVEKGSSELTTVTPESWNGTIWAPLPVQIKKEEAGLLLTMNLSETLASTLFEESAKWIRIRSVDSTLLPPLLLLPNAVTVHEESASEELLGGVATGSPHQVISLPIFPCQMDFMVRVDQDRTPWTRSDHLHGMPGDAHFFRYDAERNSIVFGDGKSGAIPGPAGRKLYLRKIVHCGSGDALAAHAIDKIRTDHPDVTGVRQSIPFAPAEPKESEEARLARFRAELFTQKRAFSLGDYERLTKVTSSSVHHVKALARGPHEIIVIVAPKANERIPVQEIERELQKAALIHQSVQVLMPAPRRFLVEARLRLRADLSLSDSALEGSLLKKLTQRFGPERSSEEPFGGALSRAEIRLALERQEGVMEVTALTLRDAASGIAKGTFDLAPTETPIFDLKIEGERGSNENRCR